MKHTLKKALSLFLCILLVLPTCLGLFATAEEIGLARTTGRFDGQLSIPVLEVKIPAVQDGIISPMEYGYSDPVVRLSLGDGLWAEDLNGNEMTEGLPEYVDLYLSQDDDALYVGIVVPEDAHVGKEYILDTFLGFGESTNSYTMNSGTTTSFKMVEKTRTQYLRSWFDFQLNGDDAQTAVIYDASGNATEGTRRYTNLQYPLPHWADIDTDQDGNGFTTYEVELDFMDAVMGSGKAWTETPGTGYFAFDLAVYDGVNQVGVLHCGSSLSEENEAPSVPHVLNLAGGNANLTSLTVGNANDFSPAFDPNVTDYRISIPVGYTPAIKATAADENALISIRASGPDLYRIEVTPSNGAPAKVYTLRLERGYKTTTYKASENTLASILEDITRESWSPESAVKINLTGTVKDAAATFFSLPTIFKANGQKLPITIDGNGSAVINFVEGEVIATNDITFQNVMMPIGDKNITLYSGACNLTFDSVDFGVTGAGATAAFFAGSPKADTYLGWTEAQIRAARGSDGKVLSTLTFAGETVYTPPKSQGILMGAVGTDLASLDPASPVSLSEINNVFLVDGATVSTVSARVGKSPIGIATVEVVSGTVDTMAADDTQNGAVADKLLEGETRLNVKGGSVSTIQGFSHAIHKGNYKVTISQDDTLVPTTVGTVTGSSLSEIKGSSYLNVSGGTFTGTVAGSGANTATYNNISGGTFAAAFYGIDTGSSRKVVNKITGGTFSSTFHGGHASGGYVRGVTNYFNAGEFNAAVYGGNANGVLYGNIANHLAGSTFTNTFQGGNQAGTIEGNITNYYKGSSFSALVRGGSSAGTVNGNITNTYSSSEFVATIYGGSNAGTVNGNITNNYNGSVFASTIYAGNYSGTVNGKITNKYTAGTFKDNVAGGSYNGDVNGNITNTFAPKTPITIQRFGGANGMGTVTGTVTNNVAGPVTFVGFSGGTYFETNTEDSIVPATIKGNIVNNLTADKNGIAASFSHRTGDAFAYLGGSRDGEITGTVTNNVEDANLNSRYYGGSYNGKIGKNSDSVSITNNISGGTFAGSSSYFHNGGSRNAITEGNVINNISGGTFNIPFAAGQWGIYEDTFTSNIKTTITGGTFNGIFYGGSYGQGEYDNHDTVSAETTIKGGVFNNAVYGGNHGSGAIRNGAVMNIHAGTFNGNVYAGSNKSTTNTAVINIRRTGELVFNGSVQGRSSSETVTLYAVRNNIVMGPQAQLILDDVILYGSATYQPIEPESTWTPGVVHVQIKKADIASVPDDPTTEDVNEAVASKKYSSYVYLYGADKLKKVVDENGTTWTGHTALDEHPEVTYPTVPTQAPTDQAPAQGWANFSETEKILSAADVEAIPQATPEMTPAELRQIVLRYFKLQSSFVWTPNENIKRWLTSNHKIDTDGDGDTEIYEKFLNQGELYAGTPYQTVGTGNLYRWLEYYDQSTGIFYLSDAIEDNGGYSSTGEKNPGGKYFFNQCSVASFWGWARVINSANFVWTADMNVYNGFIPVGGFTYSYVDGNELSPTYGQTVDMTQIARFGERDQYDENGNLTKDNGNPGFKDSKGNLVAYDTKHVISDYNASHELGFGDRLAYELAFRAIYGGNGVTPKPFYNCYAKLQPGDCLVSTGHAMMVHSIVKQGNTPVGVRVIEQIEGWALDYDSDGSTMNGYEYTRQGRIDTDKIYYFNELMADNYLPFTFAEYHYEETNSESRSYMDFYTNTILKKSGGLKGRYARLTNTGVLSVDELQNFSGPAIEDTQVIVRLAKNGLSAGDTTTAVDLTAPNMSYGTYRYLLFASNYTISDLFVYFHDADGNLLHSKIWRAGTASTRTVSINDDKNIGGMGGGGGNLYGYTNDLADRGHTITIEIQLSTGEKMQLYHGYFGSVPAAN